ncbi:uncharacterized protein LOC123565576 [Mercenaria mercenaria]|uniref:uncharacterized protein LOC123565576 n=1 Tax=Mercenaria mercenaria TaxID=6596 RepID=UPI00234E98D0|nr:uncharacterized protein LOC123565576 [Mercenaria mercenaria]
MDISARSLANSDSSMSLKFRKTTDLLTIFSFLTLVTILTAQWSDKKGPGSHEKNDEDDYDDLEVMDPYSSFSIPGVYPDYISGRAAVYCADRNNDSNSCVSWDVPSWREGDVIDAFEVRYQKNDEHDYVLEVMDTDFSFIIHVNVTSVIWHPSALEPPDIDVYGRSPYGNVSSVGLVSLDFKPPIFDVLGRSSYDSEISLTRKNITNLLPLELLHENVFGYGMADAGLTVMLLCIVCIDFTMFIAMICRSEKGRIMRFISACRVVTKGLLRILNNNGRRRFKSLLLMLHKDTRINAKRNQHGSTEKHSTAATDVAPTADAKRTLCKVCLDEEMCVMFLPCCHLATCESCADRLHCCVVCRSSIEGSFNVTMI